ncbi:uncharacterized protein LOC127439014 isoform X4 [Myxocyprinus asiaticus]|uniref:uncharacterized protein LOC127439014 isoform X4 n=1 Tax=Myxocyprinus asiaticus TaxID=70543 RepID=UPI002223101F|nr:uncharacterized protein LOC127439014 isoform X4 [Myxocyprinus asiaticus]
MSFIKSKLPAINNNMKNTFKTLLFISLMCGVLGADEIKTVMEGDSITLQTDDTEILTYNLILWRFEGVTIARITKGEIKNVTDGRFRGRLKLDQQTGSLTITNTRTNHSGVYKTEISTSSTGTMEKSFTVIVYDFPPVIDPGRSEVKSVSVIEGGSVTLNTDIKPHGDELIVWRFGDILIAKDDKENNKTSFYPDERFKERIQLDQTGSLIIRDSRTADTGEYKLKISSSNRETKYKRFSLYVKDSGLSAGAIAGITVGVVVGVGVVGVLIVVGTVTAFAGVMYCQRRIYEQKIKKDIDRWRAVFMMKGESVPLITDDAHIKTDDVNVYHGETLIAEIRRGEITSPVKDEIRERLKLDHYTGSLFITNTRRTDSGLYILKTINRTREISYKRINVTVRDAVISNTVMKGNSVYLNSDVTELQKDADVVWRFKNTVIADKKQNDKTISLRQDALNGKFKQKLQVDQQTGSLTITNSRTDQSGDYDLNINSSRVNVQKRFYVSVIDPSRSVMSILPFNEANEMDGLINIESADGVNESDGLMNNAADVGVNEKQGTSSV